MRYFKLPRDMRADQVCVLLYNDVNYTQELVRLNPGISCMLVMPAGKILIVPEKKEAKPTGVHLW